MPKVPVYDHDGQQVGELELADAIFGIEPNKHLLHQAVLMYLSNQRQGTHSTKTRSEVRGGGRKPWRQKGTGRARQGSIRAVQWRKGGIAFGPKPRDYRFDMPKKARRLALRHALSSKVRDGDLVVLDRYALERPRTKLVSEMLRKFQTAKGLVVTADGDIKVYKSARNIPGSGALGARDLNTYRVLQAAKVFITRDALAVVEEVLS